MDQHDNTSAEKPLLRKIGVRNLISVPPEVMQTLGLVEGDFVEITVEDRKIVLKPKRLIDLD